MYKIYIFTKFQQTDAFTLSWSIVAWPPLIDLKLLELLETERQSIGVVIRASIDNPDNEDRGKPICFVAEEGEVGKSVVAAGQRIRGVWWGGGTGERTNPWRASRAATDTASCSGRPCYVIFHGSFPFTFSVQEPESPDLHEQRYTPPPSRCPCEIETRRESTSQIFPALSLAPPPPRLLLSFCPISSLNSGCFFWQTDNYTPYSKVHLPNDAWHVLNVRFSVIVGELQVTYVARYLDDDGTLDRGKTVSLFDSTNRAWTWFLFVDHHNRGQLI